MLEKGRALGFVLVCLIALPAFAPNVPATTPHSISCDGSIADWAADERCGARNGTEFFVTWDATYVFFAWNGTNLVSQGDLFIYMNTTSGGSSTTTDWSGTHTLPFLADYVYCIEHSGYYALRSYSGSWSDMGISLPLPYCGWASNGLTEIAIERAVIGDPTSLEVMAFLQDEESSKVLVSYPTKNAIGHFNQNFTAFYTMQMIDGYSPGTSGGVIDLDVNAPVFNDLNYSDFLPSGANALVNYSISEIGGGLNGTFVRYSTNNWATSTDVYATLVSGDYMNGSYTANLGSFPSGSTIEFAVYAVDFSGHEVWMNNASQNYKIEIQNTSDAVPPTISGFGFTPLEPTSNDQITFYVDASDNVGLANVTMRWTTDGWTTQHDTLMTLSGANYSCTIGPFASNANLTFCFRATDLEGNEAWLSNSSNNYYIIIKQPSDTTPPVFNSVMHVPSAPTSADVVTIYVNVTDSGSGVSNVTLIYTIDNWATQSSAFMNFSGNYSYQLGPFNASTVVKYTMHAYDLAGNEAWSNTMGNDYTFTVGALVDTTPPSITNVSVAPPSPQPYDEIRINATITDSQSGVKNATVRWTKDNWATSADVMMMWQGGNQWSAYIGTLDAGTVVKFAVRAYDNASNEAWNNNGGANFQFTVGGLDTTPPTIISTTRTPTNPLTSEIVNITTVVHDNVAISSVILHWSMNNWATVYDSPMNLTANDTYSILIGPFSAGTTVLYVIHAFDSSNNDVWDNNGGANYQFTVTSQDAVPPTITNTTHIPASPTNADNITIECDAFDANGLSSVNLIWTSNNWATAHGDAMSNVNGTRYRKVIGPFASGTTIIYCVNATDVFGNVRWDNNNYQNYQITIEGGTDVTPPVIQTPTWSPSSPSSEDAISIFARVTDNNAVAHVYVRYTTNNWSSYSETELLDVGNNTYGHAIGTFSANSWIYFAIRAVDAASNEAWNNNNNMNYLIVVGTGADVTGPYIYNTGHIPSTPLPYANVTIHTTVEDDGGVHNVSVGWTSDNWATMTYTTMTNTIGSDFSVILPGFADGTTVYYYIRAYDESGNMALDNSGGLNYHFTVSTTGDVTPPYIETTTRIPSSPAHMQNVTVGCNAYDTDSGMSGVMLRVTYNNWSSFTDINMTFISQTPYFNAMLVSYAAILPGMPAGSVVQYCFKATDNVGNTYWDNNNGNNYRYDVTVLGDTTPPSIPTVVHTPSSPTPEQNVTIVATATDADSGIARVVLHWTADSWANVFDTDMGIVMGSSAPGETGSYAATIGVFAEGTVIQYVIFADDNAGLRAWNNNYGNNYWITINGSGDGNPPNIQNVFTNPIEPWDGTNISICAVVTDDESGVQAVYAVWTSDGWATVHEDIMNNTSGDFFSYMIGMLPVGTTVIYCIKALDNVGHVAWANNGGANYQFTVQPPEVVAIVFWGTNYMPSNPNPNSTIYVSTTTRSGVSAEIVWTSDNWATVNTTQMYITYVGHAPPYNAYHGGVLGPFAANTTIKFALHGTDVYGNEGWDNNNGNDYTFTVTANGDSYPPFITSTTFTPATPLPSEQATITTNVTDTESGVMSVILHWTNDFWTTVYDTNMTSIGGDLYACSIGPFPDGTVVEFAIRAEDFAAHVAWDNNGGSDYQITIASTGDSYPPTISNTVYNPVLPTNTTNITVSTKVVDTGLGVDKVYVVWTTDNWATHTDSEMTLTYNSIYVKNLGTFPSGTGIWFAIHAVDLAGNVAWDSNYGNNYYIFVEGTLDTTPPTITGTSHSPASPNSTTNITISSTITDNVGVASAFVRWTSNNWQAFTDTPMNAIGSVYAARLPQFAGGTTIIYCIRASDTSGNVAWDNNNGNNYQVTVTSGDMTAPVITDVKRAPYAPLPSDTIVITANVTDNALHNVTLVWTDNGWATVRTNDMTLVSNALYRAAIGPFAAGTTIEYCVRAIDESNNVAWNSNGGLNYVFTVYASDMTPPTIWNTTWTPASPVAGESVTVSTQVSDSSAVSVYFYHTTDNWATVAQPIMNFTGASYKITVNYPVGTTVIFVIKAVDASNNTAWDNNGGLDYSFTFTSSDAVPPTISNTTHSPLEPSAGGNVTVTTRVNDNVAVASVILYWTSDAWSTIHQDAMALVAGDLYRMTLGPLSEGTHIEYVIHALDGSNNDAWDNNGGTNYHIIVAGTADTTPPTITNVSQNPSASAVSPSSLVTIQANVVDNVALHNVTLVWSPDAWATIHADDMTQVSQGVFTYAFGPFASGTTVEYCVRAIDNAGNIAWNSNNNLNYAFTVTSSGDALAPLISGTSHSPQSPKPADSVVVTTTVSDTNSGVHNVTLYWTSNSWLSITETSMSLAAGSLYSCTIGPFSVGTTVEYVIRAYDQAGNVAWDNNNYANYAFTVTTSGDAIAPSITNVRNLPGEPKPSDSVVVQATVTDSGGVASVVVNYTTDNWATFVVKPMSVTSGDTYSCVLGTFSNGITVRYKVVATDVAGNSANVERTFTVTLTGDSTPPLIAQVSFTPTTPKPTEQALIKATVTDSSAISSVKVVYSTNNWTSSQEAAMAVAVADDYTAKLGPFPEGTLVKFRIVAVDSSGNTAYSNSTSYSFIVSSTGDAVAPTILGIGVSPQSPKPTDQLVVNATVTDDKSGVKIVTLNYTTNDWASFQTLEMALISGNNYVGRIGPFANGTLVQMKIEAIDNANNKASRDTWKDGAKISVRVLTNGDSIAPEISQIYVSPASPKPLDQVIVSCFVSDASGISIVYFVYTTDNWTTQHYVKMNESLPGKYACVGLVYQQGQLIQFNIQALDLFGNRATKDGGRIAGEGADTSPPVFISFNVSQVGDKVYVVWVTDEESIGTVEFMLHNVTSTREETVWGSAHNMTFTVTSDHVGAVYTFRIIGRDRNGNVASSNSVAIVIAQANHAPVLSSPLVSPSKGNTNTKFTFSVAFSDEDGDEPTFVAVIIDGGVNQMALEGGAYVFTTKLSSGKHTYYFRASDGTDDGLVELKNGASEWTLSVANIEKPSSNNLLILGAVGAVVAGVAVAGIFLMMRKKGKGEVSEPSSEPHTEEAEEPKPESSEEKEENEEKTDEQ